MFMSANLGKKSEIHSYKTKKYVYKAYSKNNFCLYTRKSEVANLAIYNLTPYIFQIYSIRRRKD